MGNGADAHGLSPVPAGDGFIDLVEDFQYLGSCISRDGELSREVSGCLAKAVRVFGCLHSYIFVNKSWSIDTKKCFVFALLLFCPLYCMELRLELLKLFGLEEFRIFSIVVSGVFLVCLAKCSGGSISLLSS